MVEKYGFALWKIISFFIVSAKKENAWRSSVSCILEEIMKRCFDVWRMNRIE